jgi:hypothetical protein
MLVTNSGLWMRHFIRDASSLANAHVCKIPHCDCDETQDVGDRQSGISPRGAIKYHSRVIRGSTAACGTLDTGAT